ncbi:MAG: hypothetical protein WA705_04185 [Candidatus Ozemobacteraceae bacterium]
MDAQPELFFLLRQVDQTELISGAIGGAILTKKGIAVGKKVLGKERDELSSLFGITIDASEEEKEKEEAKKEKDGKGAREKAVLPKKSKERLDAISIKTSMGKSLAKGEKSDKVKETTKMKKSVKAKIPAKVKVLGKTKAPAKAITPVKAKAPAKAITPIKAKAPAKAITPIKAKAPAKAITPIKAKAPVKAKALIKVKKPVKKELISSPKGKAKLSLKPQPEKMKPVLAVSKKITRADLLGMGVSTSTLASWLIRGVVMITAERAIYRKGPDFNEAFEKALKRAKK